MSNIAGVDGTPGGWAIVLMEAGRSSIQKVTKLYDLLETNPNIEVIAVDVPIGLLDAYRLGGRDCDRAARTFLDGPRARSVFPAPVRCVLGAKTFQEACDYSQASAPHGKKITMQAYRIMDKIREIDDLLRDRPELRDVVREVHPEVSFRELAGAPMSHHKGTPVGQEERKKALARHFPELNLTEIEKAGRRQRLSIEDILDACVACWSARRLATGQGRSLPEVVPLDRSGLPMAIWF
jgi:predicted RNase H-like nuclease